MNHTTIRVTQAGVLAGAVFFQIGCNKGHLSAMNRGEYAEVRTELHKTLCKERSDRNYVLDRMRLTIAALGDGYARQAEQPAKEMYELLSTAGVNQDRTVASAVLVENIRIWKGEPFEQATGYTYVAIQRGSVGDWDNARVAAKESLFMLKNFAENEEEAENLTTEQVARRAAKTDVKRQKTSSSNGTSDKSDETADKTNVPATEPDFFDSGYQPIETDFALGYMLAGIASLADPTGSAEAVDNFGKALRYAPALQPAVDQLRSRRFNTVLVIDAGNGPEKVRYGMDGAFAKFAPRDMSAATGLTVQVGRNSTLACVPVVDLNTLSTKHFWNNMEDVRVAKSSIGTAMLIGGATMGALSTNRDAQIAGLAIALAGLLVKASAGADTRHCEFLPQAVYIVPLTIDTPDSVVTISVPGDRPWSVVLPAIDPPKPGTPFQMRYVRLPHLGTKPGMAAAAELSWLGETAQIRYANDEFAGNVPGDDLPFILGGMCVRLPTLEALQSYQRRGQLKELSLADLQNLYVEEGIITDSSDPRVIGDRHVLEGGKSLVPPQAGTVGYTRLFCSEHPPYRPIGAATRELADRVRATAVEVAKVGAAR